MLKDPQRFHFWAATGVSSGITPADNGAYMQYADLEPFKTELARFELLDQQAQAAGFDNLGHLLLLAKEHVNLLLSLKDIEVWIARDPIDSADKPVLAGTYKARSFIEACDQFGASIDNQWKRGWNAERRTFFGRKLYATAEAASL